MRIEDLLARRSDLSTFLVHLTRTVGEQSAKDRLIAILQSQRAIATTAMGHAVHPLSSAGKPTDSQRCVCFTETPLEHVSLLVGEIEGRACQFAPYGVAITKKQGRKSGVNPVWYVDITPGHDWLSKPINELVGRAIQGGSFDADPIAKITPFIEQMGAGAAQVGGGYRKEFWWEREWRHVGDFLLPSTFIVLCPEESVTELKAVVDGLDVMIKVRFIDPRWSLEQIIARLAGFSADEAGPL